MKPDEINSFLSHLCNLAANETLPRFRTQSLVSNKREADFDPVTEADKEAESIIRDAILSTYPEHGIIGEEHGNHNAQADYQWIIDPIDGTRSFISGIPMWGTLIGLYRNEIPVAGVMDQPFTQERFLCDGAQSIYIHNDQTSFLNTSAKKPLNQAIMMTTDPRLFKGSEKQTFLSLEDAFQLSRYGADCYAFALLAAGHIELVIETGVQLYDYAAHVPIIEKAGGVFTDWQGNSNPKGGQVIAAANADIHQAVLKLINT